MEKVYPKSKKGFKWTLLSNGIKGGLGFLLIFFLTKILGPEKIGIISILMVIYGLSENFVQFGISQSIISRDKTTKNELTSIFWANLFIGFSVFLIVNLIALQIANFYNQPNILIYIRILSIVFLIEPLDLVFRAILEKELNFPNLEKVNIIKYSILSISIIVFVFLGFDIFSYVYGIILSVLTSVFSFSFIFIKNKLWVPSFHFSFQEIKPHYSFGFYVTTKSFLTYVGRNFDELIVGKILGMEILGLYYFAKKIVEKPSQLLSASFSKVSFPMFVNLKSDASKLKKAYLNLTHIIASSGFLFFGGMIFLAPILIPIIFGAKWNGSIFLIQIFSVIAFLDIVSGGFSPYVLYVFNKPRFVMKVDLFLTPLRLFLIYLASLISIKVVVLVFFCIILSKMIILQNKANKNLSTNFREYLLNIKKPIQNLFIGSFGYLCSFFFLKNFFPRGSLLISGIIFVILYLLLSISREKEIMLLLKQEFLFKNGKAGK